MSLRIDPAASCLSEEDEHELQGIISDAMGYCREGDYEHAEALLNSALGYVVNDSVRRASILRKMSILYEQQDRVDESHSCWEAARRLENAKSFGRSERLLEFIKPDYEKKSGDKNKTIGEQLMEKDKQIFNSKAVSKSEMKKSIAETIKRNTHVGFENESLANRRFISSVVSMCKEETKDFHEQNQLEKSKKALAEALKNVKPGEVIYDRDYAISWNENKNMRELSATKRKRRKRKSTGNTTGKKQSVEELKKIIRSPKTQEMAGQAALTLALRYTGQKQPKLAYKFFRKSIQKERLINTELEREAAELEKARKQWRGLKEKREGEESIVENQICIDESDKILLRAIRGVWELLILYPVAAFNIKKVRLATSVEVESARLWNPYPPVDENTPKYIFCAAPIAAHFSRIWLSQFPQLEKELVAKRWWRSGAAEQRRNSLKYFISKMYGVVAGPCADLLAEVFEEVLETREDGLNVVLVRAAAAFYVRRRHFRRSQELFARAIAIERGETQIRDVKFRSWGEPSLHSVLHIDTSLAKYVEKLPELILKATEHDTLKLLNEAPDTGRSGTTDEKRRKGEKFGKFGRYGDPLSDTWDNALLSPGISSSAYKTQKRDDRLVIPTTIGRERDMDPFLQSVGVAGRNVGATGGVQVLTRLQPVDIKRGGTKQTIPDDMSKTRRMAGHKVLWRSFTGHRPTTKSTPQGVINLEDGTQSSWYGEPSRTWMKEYQNEAREKVPNYITRKLPEAIPPPVIEKQLEEIYGGGSLGTRPNTSNTTTTEKIIVATLNESNGDISTSKLNFVDGSLQNSNTTDNFYTRSSENTSLPHPIDDSPTSRDADNRNTAETPSTRGSVYLSRTRKLEELRETARRQVRKMVHAEREAISRSTANSSRARSPSPVKPGGMASWWLDTEELEMPLHNPVNVNINKGLDNESTKSRINTASSSVNTKKASSAASSRNTVLDSPASNEKRKEPAGSTREKDLRTPNRPKDSLELLFDSRPSTRQMSADGNRYLGIQEINSTTNVNIPVMNQNTKKGNGSYPEHFDHSKKKSSVKDSSLSHNIVQTDFGVGESGIKNVTTEAETGENAQISDRNRLSRKEVLQTMGVLRKVGMS